MDELSNIIYSNASLGTRLNAWIKWCELFREMEAEEAKTAEACKGYEL